MVREEVAVGYQTIDAQGRLLGVCDETGGALVLPTDAQGVELPIESEVIEAECKPPFAKSDVEIAAEESSAKKEEIKASLETSLNQIPGISQEIIAQITSDLLAAL